MAIEAIEANFDMERFHEQQEIDEVERSPVDDIRNGITGILETML